MACAALSIYWVNSARSRTMVPFHNTRKKMTIGQPLIMCADKLGSVDLICYTVGIPSGYYREYDADDHNFINGEDTIE